MKTLVISPNMIARYSQLILLILLTVDLSAQNINTVAGNDFRGDNGPAIDANLYAPSGLALDGQGNLYIVEPAALTVRRVAPNGIITTIAGKIGRDNGVTTSTNLNFPSGIAVDGNGNIYIADAGNHRIRKVATNGTTTTVAGIGAAGFGGDGGAAINAILNYPKGVAIDGNSNLYILDSNNLRVRKVDANGIITTVAGKGISGFSGDGGAATNASLLGPSGIATDGTGNLYIADRGNSRVRKVDTNGIITTVAGTGAAGFSGDGGAATSASLNSIGGVYIDGAGNLYIADASNHRIRKVNTNSIITTVAGSGIAGISGDGGVATNASLNAPLNMITDNSGNLYIADSENKRIRKVSANDIITTIAGNGTDGYGGDGGLAINARLYSPAKVIKDGHGNLYISDNYNHRIRKIDSDGIMSTVAGTGKAGLSGVGGLAVNADIASPGGLALDDKGNLYVVLGGGRICKIDGSGILTLVAGNGTGDPVSDGGPAINTSAPPK